MPLVAEEVAEFFQVRRVKDQPVPIIVPDLVPKVAEQGAVEFAHLLASPFALGVVRFGKVDGDDAASMAGQNVRLCRSDIGQELEREARRIFGLRLDRQAQLKEGIKEPVLRDFQRPPPREILRQRQIGNDTVMPACCAIAVRRGGRNKLVARIVGSIGAMPVKFHVGDRGPNLRLRTIRAAMRFECGDRFLLGQIAKRQSAAFAARVLECNGWPQFWHSNSFIVCSVSRNPPGRHQRSRMA